MTAEKPARDRLSNEDYASIQQQIQIFGGAVAVLDLEAFIDRANHADAVAPFVDPTAWKAGHERLSAIRELAEGALRFKLAADAFHSTMRRLDSATKQEAERVAAADVAREKGGGG